MADEEENVNNVGGGGKKKLMAIVGLVLLLVVAVYVGMKLSEESSDGKTSTERKEETDVEFDPIDLAERQLITIDLGEFTASMSTLAPGDKNRRRIKMHPVLLLKPFMKDDKFDHDKNTKMKERYELTKPKIRQIILESVIQMDAAADVDPRAMSLMLQKRINSYDENNDSLKMYYGSLFGNRVLAVDFTTFDPR